jgi:hypothetical protein
MAVAELDLERVVEPSGVGCGFLAPLAEEYLGGRGAGLAHGDARVKSPPYP